MAYLTLKTGLRTSVGNYLVDTESLLGFSSNGQEQSRFHMRLCLHTATHFLTVPGGGPLRGRYNTCFFIQRSLVRVRSALSMKLRAHNGIERL